jgi:hypothetical protein
MLYAACCMLYAVCCMLYAVCCMLHGQHSVWHQNVLSARFINLWNENSLLDTTELQLCYSKTNDCCRLSRKSLIVSWTKLFFSISHVNKNTEQKAQSNRSCRLQIKLFVQHWYVVWPDCRAKLREPFHLLKLRLMQDVSLVRWRTSHFDIQKAELKIVSKQSEPRLCRSFLSVVTGWPVCSADLQRKWRVLGRWPTDMTQIAHQCWCRNNNLRKAKMCLG